ncbi:unnamed protein product [Phaeothamnion confervicola]
MRRFCATWVRPLSARRFQRSGFLLATVCPCREHRSGYARGEDAKSKASKPPPPPPPPPASLPSLSAAPSSKQGHGFLARLTPRVGVYARLARLDKPTGTLLLLWPCWWSIALAAPPGTLPDPYLLATFTAGAFVMRSAGCTINDMWDRDFDRHVARTRRRPLASGEATMPQALVFLGGQLILGLGVLLSLNWDCIALGFACMPIVVLYPLAKRFTDWPQLVLGLAMNWGALMGWTAVHGSTSWLNVLPLYGAGICWTMVYDTLYGHQDKRDDAALGLRSTALLFGAATKPVLAGFAAAGVGLLALAGHTAGLTTPFYGGTAAAAAHLLWQIYAADLEDPEQLFRLFRSNQYLGGIVATSIIAGHF